MAHHTFSLAGAGDVSPTNASTSLCGGFFVLVLGEGGGVVGFFFFRMRTTFCLLFFNEGS